MEQTRQRSFHVAKRRLSSDSALLHLSKRFDPKYAWFRIGNSRCVPVLDIDARVDVMTPRGAYRR
jgi:hypothetical protein